MHGQRAIELTDGIEPAHIAGSMSSSDISARIAPPSRERTTSWRCELPIPLALLGADRPRCAPRLTLALSFKAIALTRAAPAARPRPALHEQPRPLAAARKARSGVALGTLVEVRVVGSDVGRACAEGAADCGDDATGHGDPSGEIGSSDIVTRL
jgi:hypothetical protein